MGENIVTSQIIDNALTEEEDFDHLDSNIMGMGNLQLTAVERICLAAVLEDSVDQLAILGRIMPTSLGGNAGAPKVQT